MNNVQKNLNFGKEPVPIDGQLFFGCTFKDSTLVYSGGDLPSFEHCTFDGVIYNFRGAAGNTLTFLRVLYHVGFTDTVNKTFEDIKAVRPASAIIENNGFD